MTTTNPLVFEPTAQSYAIEIDEDRFLDLLDSESYVTDGASFKPGILTLGEKLDKLSGVSDVEYNGHFGSTIYLTIDAEDDTDDLKKQIGEVINEHLDWCEGLAKDEHVVQRRSA